MVKLQQRFEKQQPLQSSRPLSLAESFGGVRESLDRPRLHLPRRNSLVSKNILSASLIDQSTSKPIPQPQIVNSGQLGLRNLPTENRNSSPQLLAKTKIITNPLLQKLFKKDRIQTETSQSSSSRRPAQPPPQFQAQLTPSRIAPITTTTPTPPPRPLPARSPPVSPAVSSAVSSAVSPEVSLPALVEVEPARREETLFDQIKRRISQAGAGQRSEEELMNALIQQRVEEELARRAGEDEARQQEERRRLLAEAAVRRQDSVISRAREVVELRQQTNTARASPAVWAAVRALTAFVTDINSHTQVPDRVISSVKQLTDFLSINTSEEQDQQREDISVQQIETFMNNEGFQDSEAILPNFEFQKILTTKRPPVIIKKEQKQVDAQFSRDLGKQTSSVKKIVPLEVPETSDVKSTFSFSTLPV